MRKKKAGTFKGISTFKLSFFIRQPLLAYVREKEEPWKLSAQAAKLVEETAKQVGDSWFAKMVALYKKIPSKGTWPDILPGCFTGLPTGK